MNLQNISDDLQYNITIYLNIVDTITLYESLDFYSLLNYYHSFAKRIQQWYRKYKKSRDIRYQILLAEYQKRNNKMCSTKYLEIFFVSYNVKRLIKRLREYHFYARMDYFYRCDESEKEGYIQRNNILKLYRYTLENHSYSNLKIFLKEIIIPLLHLL
jgi:hypothetical protein